MITVRAPKKEIQGEFEDTRGVFRDYIPKKDRKEDFDDTTGGIRGHTSKKDKQEEFEDTKGVIRYVHRMTYKKSLMIQKEKPGAVHRGRTNKNSLRIQKE